MKYLLLILIFLIPLIVTAETEIGETWEKECDNSGKCINRIYSYQKYFNNGTGMELMNWSFDTNGCENGFDLCVDRNDYQLNLKDSTGEILVTSNHTNLSFFMDALGQHRSFNLNNRSIVDNVVTYYNFIPYGDLKYIYTSNQIKEEIIIKNPKFVKFLKNNVKMRFVVDGKGNNVFSDGNNLKIGNLTFAKPIIYDNDDNVIDASYRMVNGKLVLTFPIDIFNQSIYSYPITIDPTTILTMTEDVYAKKNLLGAYSYVDNSNNNRVGRRKTTGFPSSDDKNRLIMTWDITSLPSDATITGINLTMLCNTVGNIYNRNLTAVFLPLNNSDYTPKEAFLNMSQAKNLTTTRYAVLGFHYYNLTNATQELQDAYDNNNNTFTIGILNHGDNQKISTAVNSRDYRPSEFVNANSTPKLEITYTIPIENQPQTVINKGIIYVPGMKGIKTIISDFEFMKDIFIRKYNLLING